MIIDDPYTNYRAWDSIAIGGQISPGVVKLEGVVRPYGWDVKKGKGADGATVTHTGRQLAKFKCKFKLWLPAHFLAWSVFSQALKYEAVKGIPVTALDIFHPQLVAIDVSSVIVVNLGAPEEIGGDGSGEYEVVVEFLEYRPPPPAKATATPKGSVSNTAPDAPTQNPLIIVKQTQARQELINFEALMDKFHLSSR